MKKAQDLKLKYNINEFKTFETTVCQENIENLEDPEDIIEYLNSDEYFLNFSRQLGKMVLQKDPPMTLEDFSNKVGKENFDNWFRKGKIPTRGKLVEICSILKLDEDECDLLMGKFAGEQVLDIEDPDDAVYQFCLAYDETDYAKYFKARDLYEDDREDEIEQLKYREEFIKYLKDQETHNSNTMKASKVLKDIIEHPKSSLLRLDIINDEDKMRDKITYTEKTLANMLYYGDNDKTSYESRLRQFRRYKSGATKIKRKDFIRILIACGYCGNDESPFSERIDEINSKLEEAGFHKLYPRDQYDCLIIAAAVQADLNGGYDLDEQLTHLSKMFYELDHSEYVIYKFD